jgi:hypothetical protein
MLPNEMILYQSQYNSPISYKPSGYTIPVRTLFAVLLNDVCH